MKVKTILAALMLTQIANAGPFMDVSISVRQQPPPAARGRYLTYDCNKTANPYASIRAGWSWRPAKVIQPYVSVGHESSLATRGDYGINDVRFGLHASF